MIILGFEIARLPFVFKFPIIPTRIFGFTQKDINKKTEFVRTLGISPARYYSLMCTNIIAITFFLIVLFIGFDIYLGKQIVLGDVIILCLISIILSGIYYLLYPNMYKERYTEKFDKDLFFAVSDLSLQLDSGISLYEAMKGIAKGAYGLATKEFALIVQEVEVGYSLEEAFERAIQRSKSKQYKNVLWQIVNVFKSGSKIEDVLHVIVESLKHEQQEKISNYINELNVWALLYLMIAITIPAIITTVLAVFIPMGGGQVNMSLFVVIFTLSIILQVSIIEYVKVKRPEVSL